MWTCHVSYASFELLDSNNPINSNFHVPGTTDMCHNILLCGAFTLNLRKMWWIYGQPKYFGTICTDLKGDSSKVNVSIYMVNIFICKSKVYIHTDTLEMHHCLDWY